jgi:hypothetical protein
MNTSIKMRLPLVAFASVLCASKAVCADCGQKVEMAAYSVCFPKTWRVYREDARETVSGCNRKSGACSGNGGGFPVPGVVLIFLFPAAAGPGHPRFQGPRDLASNAPQINASVSRVDLGRPGDARNRTECWVSRSLMFGKVWNEVYGLQVGSTLFRASVQYNAETDNKVANYRDAIKDILSSVGVRERLE